jgi:hypothetical protein
MNARTILFSTALLVALILLAFFFIYSPSRSGDLSKVDTARAVLKDENRQAEAGIEAKNATLKPEIRSAGFQRRSLGDIDELKVVPASSGEKVTFSYEWMKNGQFAGREDSISGFKRGDKISVKIIASDGKISSDARTFETEIMNVPPKFLASTEYEIKDDTLTYHVKATDADGDAIKYELIGAPQGMAIDKNGVVKWTFGKEISGKVDVKIKISDGHGGENSRELPFNIEPR